MLVIYPMPLASAIGEAACKSEWRPTGSCNAARHALEGLKLVPCEVTARQPKDHTDAGRRCNAGASGRGVNS